jgi:hypothetical protein
MRNLLLHSFLIAAAAAMATGARAQSGPYQYYSLTPCRVVDTRNPAGVNGGPALGLAERDFQMKGNCGIPQTAQAVTINVTVTNATAGSWLTIWPAGLAKPFVSTINFDQNTSALANGAIVGVGAGTNDLAVQNAFGQVHVIIDVTGYFQ